MGFCEKTMSMFEGNYLSWLWDICRMYGQVYKRERRLGVHRSSLEPSKLLAQPAPGHLGITRALWCAGEKWKC